jgi:hypothetical protein
VYVIDCGGEYVGCVLFGGLNVSWGVST